MLLYIYIYVMSRMSFLERFFSNVTTIRSCPGALCGLSRFVAFFISTGVKALTGSDSWQGALSRLLCRHRSRVKTQARCSASRIELSLVERAHLLFGFLRGGVGTIGLLNFFVAFHTEWSFV
jgi:hypothetical protein